MGSKLIFFAIRIGMMARFRASHYVEVRNIGTVAQRSHGEPDPIFSSGIALILIATMVFQLIVGYRINSKLVIYSVNK